MTTLALEFSSAWRSVAVAREGTVLAEAANAAGRGIAAFAMIETVLAKAKIEREEIENIAIGLGPGSYTGIRAAIALAEGWKLASDIRLAGISSFAAIAACGQAEKIFGRVTVVVDAQRNEFYSALYEITKTAWREVLPLRILPRPAVELDARGTILIGPDAPEVIASGRAVFPSAAAVARIAAEEKCIESGGSLEPIYLRETNFKKAMPPFRNA